MRSNPIDELRRLQGLKSAAPLKASPLGDEMIGFFKQSVAKRQTKLAKLAECWAHFVPSNLSDHCSLESFSKGTLTVIVDSSSHLYEIKQLLLAGIQEQMTTAARSTGLKKINLKLGRWYDGDSPADRRVKFSK